jgi:hypothetical protein
MGFDPSRLVTLVLWGGFVTLDGASFGQFMVSRPLVAATIAGWIFGGPVQGAVVGIVLESFHLAILPVGAAKYPESGPPAVAAGAVYTVSDLEPSTLLIVMLGALLLERIGGETVRYLRQARVRTNAAHLAGPRLAANVEKTQLMGLAVDLGRGLLLTAGSVAVLKLAADWVAPFWSFSERIAQLLVVATVAGMLASAFRLVGSFVWYAVAGAAAAAIVVMLTL